MCLIIGHRGVSGYEQDNTIKSVEKAIKMEVDVIEIDIHISKDNKLIAFHDDMIGCEHISSFTSKELKTLYDIPLIEDIFEVVKDRVKILLDIKYPYSFELLSNLIKNKNNNIFIASSYSKIIKTLKNAFSGFLYGLIEEDDELLFPDVIYDFVILRYVDVTKKRVNNFKKCDIMVFTYTVNDMDDIKKCRDKIIVDGIVSDFPDRIKY
jgi:glycerophosphoryl diester phosphodiesterase